jgi:hypothetical protein
MVRREPEWEQAMSENKASETVGKPPPKCKAMLLCERTILEVGSNKWSVIGIIHKVVCPRLPAHVLPINAFIQLTEGTGTYAITAGVWDLSTDKPLAQGQGATVEFADRLSVLQFALPLPPLLITHTGSFDVVVFADGQEIDRQKFTVVSSL